MLEGSTNGPKWFGMCSWWLSDLSLGDGTVVCVTGSGSLFGAVTYDDGDDDALLGSGSIGMD